MPKIVALKTMLIVGVLRVCLFGCVWRQQVARWRITRRGLARRRGLTGAAGATHTAAVLTEVEAVRTVPAVAVDTLARVGRAEAGAPSAEAVAAAVDSVEDSRREARGWRGRVAGGRAAGDLMEAARLADLPGLQEGIRRELMAGGVTDGRVAGTAAAMRAMVGRAMRTVATAVPGDRVTAMAEMAAATTAAMRRPMAELDRAVGPAMRTEIRATHTAVTGRRRIVAIPA